MDITHPILLFDGVCNLCNGAVRFVIKRDTKGTFMFAPLQSETGQALLERSKLARTGDPDQYQDWVARSRVYLMNALTVI